VLLTDIIEVNFDTSRLSWQDNDVFYFILFSTKHTLTTRGDCLDTVFKSIVSTMPITILSPSQHIPEASTLVNNNGYSNSNHDSEDDMDVDEQAEESTTLSTSDNPSTSNTPSSRPRILTPGSVITTDPQFMRGHGTFHPPAPSSSSSESIPIHATTLGTLLRTNKLLSLTPLQTRYTPEIGDLVVARVVSVQSKRWKCDVQAPLLAHLPLSAINLPGGALRRRTSVDELNMRSFFQEGDVLVAEVQGLFQDGAAGLHARSLKYGKLRNGLVVRLGKKTRKRNGNEKKKDGGYRQVVTRAKRQVFDLQTRAGDVDVVLGVNGVVFVGLPSRDEKTEGQGMGIGGARKNGEGENTLEMKMYSCQNDEISTGLRTEIGRVIACIKALAECGISVEEDMIRRCYDAALELELDEGGDGFYLGGERASLVVDMALNSRGGR